MSRGLEGLVTVITGAASGLGEATARHFAADGALLVLGDIQTDKVAALAEELGGVGLACDVTDEAAVEHLVATAIERHGRIGCMINNAGQLGAQGTITAITRDAWDRTLAVLLSSVFFGMKHAGRAMAQAGEGVILSTASVAGMAALGPHAYTAAKHAIVGLTRSVAAELAGQGVRVNAVAPGTVPTPLTDRLYGGRDVLAEAVTARNPLHRIVTAQEVAAAFAYLAGPDARSITGQVLTVDAGLSDLRLGADYYRKAVGYHGVDAIEQKAGNG
ncbi:SDR family oxidoreductase [soil metagenome]